MRQANRAFWAAAAALSLLAMLPSCGNSSSDSKAAPPKSLGAPCVSSSEDDPAYSGHSAVEVAIELDTPDCGGGGAVCLMDHFQGRVSCPYGQGVEGKSAPTDECYLPHSDERVAVAVKPQLIHRQPDKAVYCSCRCAGPDTNAEYCECSAGFECLELVPDLGLATSGSGSYCVKKGAGVDDVATIPTATCDSQDEQAKVICGDARPFVPVN